MYIQTLPLATIKMLSIMLEKSEIDSFLKLNFRPTFMNLNTSNQNGGFVEIVII